MGNLITVPVMGTGVGYHMEKLKEKNYYNQPQQLQNGELMACILRKNARID